MESPRQPIQGEDYTAVENQNRPEGYEPQPNLQPGQSPYFEERVPDLVVDDDETDADPDDGVADGDDDAVEFDPPDERPKHL